MRNRESDYDMLGRKRRKWSGRRKGIKSKEIKRNERMRGNTVSNEGNPSGRKRREKSKKGGKRKVEF